MPYNFKWNKINIKFGFEYYGYSVVVENAEKMHIFSYDWMLIGRINPILKNRVAEIGVKLIDTVVYSWAYDKGQFHSNHFKNVLYFTKPPMIILSETSLAKPMNAKKEH